MATVTQTTGVINTGSGSVATKPAAFYDKVLLKTLRARSFNHSAFAQTRPMPKNAGDTINFRKIGVLAPATTPLTEGVTPDGNSATVTAISATTKQYGDYIVFSDVVDFQQIDPIITEYSKEQGVQASETVDVLVRDEITAGTNVLYANSRVSRVTLAAGDKPTLDLFRKAALTLKKNKVRPAANGKYVALVSPEVVFDLMDDPKFVQAFTIGQNNKPFIDGEIADVYGIKFVEVTAGTAKVFTGAGASGANVHASVVFGEEAYGITKINGEGDAQTIVKALGSSGVADALNQRQSIGWKINAFVAKRLKEEAIVRVESVPSNS
jgi:N4-gp56 family major capsid protein